MAQAPPTSDFSIDTSFRIGDELKIRFDISNDIPSTSSAVAHIVDLYEGQDIESNPELIHTLPQWSNISDHIGGLNTSWSGKPNTDAIIAQSGHIDSAAKRCRDITRTVNGVTYNDWYLPSSAQVTTLYQLRDVLDPLIINAGGDVLTKTHTNYQKKGYWASLESGNPENSNPVFSVSFNPSSGGGATFGRSKSMRFRTRATREVALSAGHGVSVGDIYGGGIVYKVIEAESGGVTPTVDLDVKIGNGLTTIFSQNTLGNNFTTEILHTVTAIDGVNPLIKWDYENSNAGAYNWETNYQIFVKPTGTITTIEAGSQTSLAWNDDASRWTSRYSYIPEYMSTFKTGIITFEKGKLYIHDDVNNKNYFYNGKYPTQVTYVENVEPSSPKVFMTHAVEGTTQPNISRFETIDNWTMNSDLIKDDYIRREGTYYSELFGDVNDPNVGLNASYGDKLMKGTKLRGQYVKVFMTFREEDLEIKHSNIGFIKSKGHTT
tara:strand:- start:572 stop:2044 length:1473 start_codon:yes stop_codon:yes gene_type:complete